MTLREFPFRISYGAADDRPNDFYIPALSRSVRFDRTAGFFSAAPWRSPHRASRR